MMIGVLRSPILLLFLLGLLLMPRAATGAGEPAPAQRAGEVTLETIPPMTLLALHVTGSYEQHATAIPQLMVFAGMRNVIGGAPFGIYHDNPEEVPTDSLRWEVCVPLTQKTRVEAPFEVREEPEMLAAVTTCIGPYENTGPCYGVLTEWLAANGYELAGAPQEHWLSDAQATPPESLQARIVFPVKKK